LTKSLTIIVIGVVLVVCLSAPASAINVKPSSDTGQAAAAPPTNQVPAKSFQTAPVKSERGLLDKLKRQVNESKRTTGRQFDNYIDADGDGVDDRLAKQAKVKEQTEKAKPATAAPEQKTKSKRAVKQTPLKEKP